MRRRPSLLTALVLPIAIACAPIAGPAGSPSASPAWVAFTAPPTTIPGTDKAISTFRIAVPPEWAIDSPTGAAFTKMASEVRSNGPSAPYTLQFLAHTTSTPHGSTTIALVTTWRLPQPETVEDVGYATYYDWSKDVYALFVRSETLQIGSLPVRRQHLRWEDMSAPGAPVTMGVVQYFIVRNMTAYELEFEGTEDDLLQMLDTFDAIARTLVLS